MMGLDLKKLEFLLKPTIDKAEREQRAANDKRRPALSQERQELERLDATRAPAFAHALETADAKLAHARAELEAAQAERDAAFQALTGWSSEAQLRRSKLEAELRETADPAIAAALAEVEVEIERTRRRSAESTEVVDIDRAFDKKVTTIYTTIRSIHRRLEALRAMRTELTKLELEVGVDVDAQLTQLWAGIPAIGATEAFRRTKPEFVK